MARGCDHYPEVMSGVTWDQRKPSDWLASNGRWYPKSTYPNGWSRSALPPAPDHGGVGSILRRLTDGTTVVPAPTLAPSGPPPSAGGNGQRPSSGRPTAPSSASTSASAPGFSVARTGRAVADATVTAHRTHTPRVAAGTPPPPALPSQSDDDLPPPPGRVRDDAPKRPPAPTPTTAVMPAPPPHEKTDLEVVAGDLGRVFGSAKKRIERALNEAAEGQ